MADDLETLTAQIKSRLGEQNQILKNCVQKYQDSQRERADIANNIQRITDELTKATNNLQTIEQQQYDFRTEKAKKEETYIREKGEMETKFNEERAKIEEEKKGQLEAAKKHEANEVARITQEQERLKQKALEDEQKREEVAEAKSQEQAAEQKRLSDEALLKTQQDLTEFREKLKNEQNERKTEQEKLNKQHEEDLANAKTNEEKFKEMQNQINNLKKSIEDLNTKHGSDLKSMEEKGKNDLNEQKIAADAALVARETELKTVHEESMKLKEEEHTSLMKNLMLRQEQKVSASANTSQAKIQDLENQLKQCNEKFALSQQLYEDNKAELDKIEADFKSAENVAAQALLVNVNKLSEENKKLQAQISKMTEGTKVIVKPSTPVMSFADLSEGQKVKISEIVNEMKVILDEKSADDGWWESEYDLTGDKLTEDNKINALLNAEETQGERNLSKNEEKLVISQLKSQLGGYKHGKSSKKKNKRSLESKLTAKKFSLKKRSKRGKIKGKSKKRRKSIKIRI